MKTLKLSNGEIRLGYEFSDLPTEIQDKVISDHIDFEIEVMDEDSPYYERAVEMEKNRTPWFLASEIYHNDKESIIETIVINNYLFDIDGEMLPITYHYNGNNDELIKSTFGKHEYTIEFI